jgi:hypothetical protein
MASKLVIFSEDSPFPHGGSEIASCDVFRLVLWKWRFPKRVLCLLVWSPHFSSLETEIDSKIPPLFLVQQWLNNSGGI